MFLNVLQKSLKIHKPDFRVLSSLLCLRGSVKSVVLGSSLNFIETVVCFIKAVAKNIVMFYSCCLRTA